MATIAEPDTLDLPIVNLELYLQYKAAGDAASEELTKAAKDEAANVADALHNYGILIIKDPRASAAENDVFLDMLEQYFEQPEAEKMTDVRKEYFYQVGATPSRVELPRNHCERMKAFKETDKPLSLCPPEKDPKWRFFWRMGDRPPATKFEELNAAPVIPAAFPQWPEVMNSWGTRLIDACFSIAELAAIGFGMPADAFSSRMQYGPHLLAPTASDFNRFGALHTVLAGYHYDLNFFTCHGRSRYPGLYIWTRDGSKRVVKIPEGCLLLQAGKQAEWLTGGYVLGGFHEVVVTPATVSTIEKSKAEGKSLWRISSTLFSHIASDVMLEPLAHFATEEAKKNYPPMYTGEMVQAELKAINLGEGSQGADTVAQQ